MEIRLVIHNRIYMLLKQSIWKSYLNMSNIQAWKIWGPIWNDLLSAMSTFTWKYATSELSNYQIQALSFVENLRTCKIMYLVVRQQN